MARDAIAIVGPTASGKSAVAVEVARRIGGEVVSVDSRQVYCGMDIGTAKPSMAERGGVPHHGFDLVDPDERYSAGRFARAAWQWIDEIRARGRVPVLAGGTGFFLRALTRPMFDEPAAPDARREALKQVLCRLDAGDLVRWAAALDPEGGWDAERGGGRQRAARAVEVALLTGRPLTWWHRQPTEGRTLVPLVFVLELPRAVLYERIDRRVDAMIDNGLVAEVATLIERGHTPQDPGLSATGYAEIVRHLDGTDDLATARQRMSTATRQYARRQITWFRNQLVEDAMRVDATAPVAAIADVIVREWSREERA
ncbi:MAG: tRNA (adenosine(37)-N6)-dimethylallyltransferase MiaA [Longimicrobiales bacterium]